MMGQPTCAGFGRVGRTLTSADSISEPGFFPAVGLGAVPGKTAVRRCREDSGEGRAGREVVPANPSRPTGAGRLAGYLWALTQLSFALDVLVFTHAYAVTLTRYITLDDVGSMVCAFESRKTRSNA